MSELTNPNTPISEQDLKDFYEKIKPYLGTNAAPSEDMSEIVSPLPSIPTRMQKYSTQEQIVGEWIDGKPIYQKTVECGALPNNTTKNVAHNITNISEWISITGISYVNNSGKGGMSLPLVYHNSSSVNNCLLQANSENIILRTEGDRSPYDVTYVTLQYTKTTD